ncbi:MAG: hypothetical protein QOF81_1198, partial [Acidimicrobiaceae bacterium]|nr:hypothetical protein [Acidimicrobiaceae bacterium]
VAVLDTGAADPDPDEISELRLLRFEDAVDLLQSDAGAPWAADVLRRSNAALSRVRLQPQPDYAASDDVATSRVDQSAETRPAR